MNKKILIIDGHPLEKSLCKSIADTYQNASTNSQVEVKRINIRDLSFDLNLLDFKGDQKLEENLIEAQDLIKWCNHLVVVYPIWWGMMPALLKGFIDRVLLPGFAFKYHDNDPMWDKLLKGKSARVIVTSDSPVWYLKLFLLGAPYKIMKTNILDFCGFKPVKLTTLGSVRQASSEKVEAFLEKVRVLGSRGE
jgi:NAD(P)H dehydrogenase (quinone)